LIDVVTELTVDFVNVSARFDDVDVDEPPAAAATVVSLSSATIVVAFDVARWCGNGVVASDAIQIGVVPLFRSSSSNMDNEKACFGRREEVGCRVDRELAEEGVGAEVDEVEEGDAGGS